MAEPRPRFNAEIAKLAATEIANALVEQRLIGAEARDGAIEDIAKHASHRDDGYTIAKALDSYCGWDCDFHIAEALDGFGRACDGLIGQAEKAWAERTNPQPPLALGTRIKMPRGRFGVLDGISAHEVASYAVKVEGDVRCDEPTNSRWIVHFEDAVAAEMETV